VQTTSLKCTETEVLSDDKAIDRGLWEISHGRTVMFIGHQKGRNTKQRQAIPEFWDGKPGRLPESLAA
jgi:acetyl-CoA carboxylase alpha subunit